MRFVVQVAADGRVIQFDDDCSEQDVITAMRELYPPPEPTPLQRAERTLQEATAMLARIKNARKEKTERNKEQDV